MREQEARIHDLFHLIEGSGELGDLLAELGQFGPAGAGGRGGVLGGGGFLLLVGCEGLEDAGGAAFGHDWRVFGVIAEATHGC